MHQQILVLSHGYPRGGDRLLHAAAARLQVGLHTVDLLQTPVPDLSGFSALIVAFPAVDGSNSSALVEEEKRALQAWISLDRPCLGLGGGHLLLAEVMGAAVGPNFTGSHGVTSGHLTHDGRSHPLFAGIDTPFPLFKRHDRSIQTPVPRSILLLATSSECVVEAFCGRGRSHIIGLQFENHYVHPEKRGPGSNATSILPGRCRKGLNGVGSPAHAVWLHRREIKETFGVIMKNFIGLLG